MKNMIFWIFEHFMPQVIKYWKPAGTRVLRLKNPTRQKWKNPGFKPGPGTRVNSLSGALQGRRCRRRCRANRSRFRGYIKKANTIKKHGARVPNKTITFSETKRPHRGILGRTSQNQKNPNWMKQRTFCSSVVPERSKRLSKKCSASFIYSDLLKICI